MESRPARIHHTKTLSRNRHFLPGLPLVNRLGEAIDRTACRYGKIQVNGVEDKAVIGIAPPGEIDHTIGSRTFALFFPKNIANGGVVGILGMPYPHRNI